VQAWREKHREYGQEEPLNAEPLQEMIMGQSIDQTGEYGSLPLQEVGESVEEIGI
jgi:hypothetical protein